MPAKPVMPHSAAAAAAPPRYSAGTQDRVVTGLPRSRALRRRITPLLTEQPVEMYWTRGPSIPALQTAGAREPCGVGYLDVFVARG